MNQQTEMFDTASNFVCRFCQTPLPDVPAKDGGTYEHCDPRPPIVPIELRLKFEREFEMDLADVNAHRLAAGLGLLFNDY